jgi:CRISPR/Cas system-associated endonuclease Cas1
MPDIMKSSAEDDVDVLAEEPLEPVVEPPRVWPKFDQALQEKVDKLAATTDIARQLSVAMGQSALNATKRIIKIARLQPSEVGSAIALQEKYLVQGETANPNRLLTLEALIMRQYWRCFGAALKDAQQWFGPRKRSRFVREFVSDPAGRARGYTAVDAAINYLHQRRLRQAERINAEIGFPGTCDGFLHRERYNSRGIGLLLDIIDPFKFADREELLVVTLNGGISWIDFRIERDRRGSSFYYPTDAAEVVLSRAGEDADRLRVKYLGRESSVIDAYKLYARDTLELLDSQQLNNNFGPFAFIVEL